jgi:hypothetical protein
MSPAEQSSRQNSAPPPWRPGSPAPATHLYPSSSMKHSGGRTVRIIAKRTRARWPRLSDRCPVQRRYRSPSKARVATAVGVTRPRVLGPVGRGCFIAAPIATPGSLAGVNDRINTHVRRCNHAGQRSAGRRWCDGMRRNVPGDLERSCSQTANANRKPASVCQRRLMPKGSGAAEGVGDARRPAPVQIDHSGRRGPFSGS